MAKWIDVTVRVRQSEMGWDWEAEVPGHSFRFGHEDLQRCAGAAVQKAILLKIFSEEEKQS